MGNSNTKKQTKGRKKINMTKRREKQNDLMTTFSKRRSGIYKSASELNMLTGGDFVLCVTSPTGNLFHLSSPNLESVASKLLHNQEPSSDSATQILEASTRNVVKELADQLTKVMNLREEEEAREETLVTNAMNREGLRSIVEAPVTYLTDENAEMLKAWLLNIHNRFNERIQQLKQARENARD
ncbi:agamous-like MADS-box protein AGL62 [Impatiens glandulifera]|uniref:agamous-like MADS-box protein AGL62 n=1 Tax=Impatiens glandulifera TaxID=253017 RepID=UPI001FB0DF43|nr:agamous-like MADS-box protein AGL62 [Impatiens glandulifera]